MLEDLPPLPALPVFEAAGRLGSFKAAAAELHVTPSAVSQQIKSLEDALGVKLFERVGRAVVLTEAGTAYLAEVRQALSDVANAGRRLRRRTSEPVLRLSTVPFVAFEFLLPRLSRFREMFPNLELRLETSMKLVDFAVNDVDAAIRVGGGPWPGLVTRPIGRSATAVVCSPALCERIRRVSDLRRETLIDIRGQEHRGWRSILRSKGLSAEGVQWLSFETYFETIRAAEQGLGVALGLFPFTTAWVTAGRLAVPFSARGELPGSISLVHRAVDEDRFPLNAIATWLEQQYAELDPLPPGRMTEPHARS